MPAPDDGPGNWTGAASAVLVDGTFWLTYRVRRPLTDGRGVAVVVARSDDGVRFETSPRSAARRSAASPSSARCWCRCPGFGWRLYLSARRRAPSTGGSTASPPTPTRAADRLAWSCPATSDTAVKDPVVHGRRRLGDVAVLPPARRARATRTG